MWWVAGVLWDGGASPGTQRAGKQRRDGAEGGGDGGGGDDPQAAVGTITQV